MGYRDGAANKPNKLLALLSSLRKTKHKHGKLIAIYYIRKVPGRKKLTQGI